jgi:predicted acyltransferase (DUF342 family)
MARKYSFSGGSNGINPPLILVRGLTYTFNISTPGYRFYIKTVRAIGTSNLYTSGVTNNGTDNGTITFAVPQDAPNILYYVNSQDIDLSNEIFVVNSSISIIGDPYIQGNTRVSGSISMTGSLNVSGSTFLTGSLRVTGSQTITGSLNISGSTFMTGSLRVTGSQTITGSLDVSGSTFMTGSLRVTGSQFITGSLNISGSTFLTGSARITGSQIITGSSNISGSTFLTGSSDISGSSYITGSSFITGALSVSGSTSLSGSVNIFGSGSVSGSWTVTGDITARQIIISSSIIYVTESYADGSHKFGNTQDDTHQFTGSVFVSHSLTSLAFTGSSYTGSFTGSFSGTSSYALTASYISERVKTLNELTYTVPSFLKLTGNNTVSQDINDYLTVNNAASTYVTATYLLSNYSTTSTIASTYQTILSNPITGTGTRTANYVSKFGSSSTIQNSIIYDNGSIVGVNNTGTVTGGGTLQVGGDVNITGVFKINGNTISTSQWITSGNNIYYNSAGNVMMGNTTTNRTNPFHKLTVNPAVNTNFGIGIGDSNAIQLLSYVDAGPGSGFNGFDFGSTYVKFFAGFEAQWMEFNKNATYRVDLTGNVRASAYYEASDIRLKNVIEINPNIDLSSLGVIKYTRKNVDDINQIYFGYSAQDVQLLCEDLVQTDGEYLSLNYTNVHTLKISQLEKEIKALKQLIKNK